MMSPPRIVLVPGLMNDADLWRDQLPALSQVAQPVVADITRGETLADLAQAVIAAGGPRFALAGFSLGGIVAQKVMRSVPERVSHLALLDTTARPDDPARQAERARLVDLARRPGQFHGFGTRMAQSYLATENAADEALVRRVRDMTTRLGAKVFVRQSLIDRPDLRPDLRRIRCPVLLLCGAEDRLTPPDTHREMASLLPQARLVVLPGAGHLAPMEKGVAVARELLRLLRQPGPAD
jgi:pimeloyl-ACP methyl ester carboxylesterase